MHARTKNKTLDCHCNRTTTNEQTDQFDAEASVEIYISNIFTDRLDDAVAQHVHTQEHEETCMQMYAVRDIHVHVCACTYRLYIHVHVYTYTGEGTYISGVLL